MTDRHSTRIRAGRRAAAALVLGGVLAAAGAAAAAEIPLPVPNPMRGAAAATTAQAPAADDHPTPTGKPETAQKTAAPAEPVSVAPVVVSGSFKDAIEALRKDRVETAIGIRNGIKDPVAGRLLDWLIIRKNDPAVSSARIKAFIAEAPHWPIDAVVYRRLDAALERERPSPGAVIAAFNGRKPASTRGAIALARAYLASGDKAKAASVIRAAYAEPKASADDVVQILKEFGSLLRKADHKLRMDRLLYDEKTSLALAVTKRLGGSYRKLAEARIAVIKRSKKAGAALKAVPSALRADPGYTFSRIQYLRRSKKPEEAAKLLLSATRKPDRLVDADEWWIERRLISRAMLDRNDAKTAYKIAAGHSAQSAKYVAEAEFHAGWYALRYLNEPRRAEPHFKRIVEVSKGAKSLSRGHYWLGRTAKARGDRAGARRHFENAARYATAYHGQLARAELGGGSLRMSPLPKPGAAAKAKFRKDERIRAIAMLKDAGSLWLAAPLFRHLAKAITDDEQIVLLAGLAEGYGQHNLALQVGILASKRSNRLEALAFPISAIPRKARISGVEKPLVYAIARQESAFNPRAVSHAGARGLLQLMPGTAKRTARNIGLGYSKSKLTADPAYNATLGAAHLDELVDKFGGSYIMTFAGYNAGAGRVDQWVARYGDPRSQKVDAIDWIERIPFTETRNYVQKILENLQVYRARLHGKKLGITKDLKRGG